MFGDSFATTAAAAAATTKLEALAYQRYDKMFQAYAVGVSEQQQRQFLLKTLYFGELSAPANPKGPSYQQYIRGYRAVQTLFPASSGYTDNLSTFTTDAATVSADHPLGEATKVLVNGEPARATRIITARLMRTAKCW